MKNAINTVAQIIAKTILSPLVYMVEHDGRIDFVYITNEPIGEDALYDVQSSAESLLKCDVDIIDIRYFSEFDKINLLQQSKIVYCENPMLPKMIEVKALESLKTMLQEKNNLISRIEEIGCYYLQ